MPDDARNGECILVAHGFLGSPMEFWPMRGQLERLGYQVEIWGHASVFCPLDEYTEKFCQFVLGRVAGQAYSRIHLLGHSMGAIIARAASHRLYDTIPELRDGKLILLAPPNKGSHVARGMPTYIKKAVPAIGDLTGEEGSFVRNLPAIPPLATGVVWTKWDHLVTPESAALDGAVDSIEVGGIHTSMVFQPNTAKLIDNFIRVGSF